MNKLDFKNIKLKRLVYPGIIVIIIVGMGLSAFFTVKFLTTNINAAFTINESSIKSELVTINLESYEKIAKKLEIPFPYPSTETTPPSEEQ